MNVQKIWILLLLLAGLGTVVVLGNNIFKDKEGPDIIVPAGQTYSSDMEKQDLLKGVTATDKEDGDVSSSLMIENILVLTGESYAKVTYVAKDNSNNVTEKSVIMVYNKGNVTQEDETTKDTPEETTTEVTTKGNIEEPTTPVQTESAEAPVLTLTNTEITLKKGSNVKWTNYVADIKDDKDPRNVLFKYIMIDDYADLNKVGDYVMSYSCKDTENNVSPRVKLIVHVTE